MANKLKQMQLKMLDKHLVSISFCEVPSGGWINAIRKGLSMSARQLAERIGVSQQSASRLEANEVDGSISIKSLRRAAEAMDCRLVYAFVPKDGGVRGIVHKQALKKAKELLEPVDRTMMLENQAVANIEGKIEEIASELEDNLSSRLWD